LEKTEKQEFIFSAVEFFTIKKMTFVGMIENRKGNIEKMMKQIVIEDIYSIVN